MSELSEDNSEVAKPVSNSSEALGGSAPDSPHDDVVWLVKDRLAGWTGLVCGEELFGTWHTKDVATSGDYCLALYDERLATF